MADPRQRFTRNLYIAVFSGAAVILALHVTATVLLLRATGVTLNPRALVPGLLLIILQISFSGSFAFIRSNPHVLPAVILASLVHVVVALQSHNDAERIRQLLLDCGYDERDVTLANSS